MYQFPGLAVPQSGHSGLGAVEGWRRRVIMWLDKVDTRLLLPGRIVRKKA